jgi:hypothetical protein
MILLALLIDVYVVLCLYAVLSAKEAEHDALIEKYRLMRQEAQSDWYERWFNG